MKKFYAVVGNPPYQETMIGTSDSPLYDSFMDEAYKTSDRVELITPGRFLFRAGKTSKEWNDKMLSDQHLKVLQYEPESSLIFPNTSIKGGIAVTYRDANKEFGAIGIFTLYPELKNFASKIIPHLEQGRLTDIIYLQNRFNLQTLYSDFPKEKEKISSNGKERRIVSSAFDKLSVFKSQKETSDSVKILGLTGANKRTYKWILRSYIEDNGNFELYKVVVPKANGKGEFGERLSNPTILEPYTGYTQSFIGIGSLKTYIEAQSTLKYIKTKFVRALLSTLKITQDNPPEKWEYIPLQDFSASSDIDWSQSVADIDRQLYAKYGLSDDEIEFIESHVKEMD